MCCEVDCLVIDEDMQAGGILEMPQVELKMDHRRSP
jgi:hypothetical protein